MLDENQRKTIINKHNMVLLSENINGASLRLKCKCCGHIVSKDGNKLDKFEGCPQCLIEVKIEKLKTLGFTPISENLGKQLVVKCNNGHIIKRAYNIIVNEGQTTCDACEKQKRIDFVNKNTQFTVLDEDKKNCMTVKCPKGHVSKRHYGVFERQPDIHCNKCVEEYKHSLLKKYNYKLIEMCYTGHWVVECSNGHRSTLNYNMFKNGRINCVQCYNEKRKNLIEKKGYEIIKTCPMTVKCKKCGYIFSTSVENIKNGVDCVGCKTNKLFKIISKK